jgi:hypothetical protein
MSSRLGVRAEPGRANGDCGGMIAFELIGSGLWLMLSREQDEQLLEREEELDLGDEGLEVAVGAPAVLVKDVADAVVAIDSDDAVEGRAGFSGKVKREVPFADMGLMRVGESLERKSR